MSKLAHLIAQEEGFGIPGSIPTRYNNPGDLRHSPHSFHKGDPQGIGQIDSVEHGWEDLERQLGIFAKEGLDLKAAVYKFAPPSENHTELYLDYVAKGLGVLPTISMIDALKIGEEQKVNSPAHSTYASAGIGSMAAVILAWICSVTLKQDMPPAVSAAVAGLISATVGYFLHRKGEAT